MAIIHNRAAFVVLLIVISLVALIPLRYSAPHGVATSPDSYTYFFGARNLLAGQGYESHMHVPITLWPPLYPVLLAVIWAAGDVLGIAPNMLDTLWWINASTLIAIVLTSAALFGRYIHSRALVLIATAAVALGHPEILVASFAWSEALCVLSYIGFMLVLLRYLDAPRPRLLLIAAMLAALASLQRWVGVFLIGTGAVSIALLAQGKSGRQRVAAALSFGITASLPIAIWLARNQYMAGTFVGSRESTPRTLQDTYRQLYDTLSAWFIPADLGIGYMSGSIALSVALGMFAMVAYRRGYFRPHRLVQIVPIPMLMLIGVYIVFFVQQASIYNLSDIDDRFMAPIHTFVLCLGFMFLDVLLVHYLRDNRRLQMVLLTVAAIWIVVPLYTLNQRLPELRATASASQNKYDAWHASDLIDRLRTSAPEGELLTNAPAHLLVHTGRANTAIPSVRKQLELRVTSAGDAGVLIAWFTDVRGCDYSRKYCVETDYSRTEIEAMFAVEALVTAQDGALLRVRAHP